MALTCGLKEKIGTILMAKVLGDGGWVVKEQREKAMKLQQNIGDWRKPRRQVMGPL